MDITLWQQGRAGHWLGSFLSHNAVMTSTHEVAAAELPRHAERGRLYWADQQSAGRGRNQRHWEAADGKDLLFTFIDLPTKPAEKIPQLTLVAGMAFHSALTRLFPTLALGLKWPNDLMLGKNKLGGLLCSYEPGAERVLISLGLNVNSVSTDFSPLVQDRAISLLMATGTPVEREPLLVALLDAYEEKRALYDQAGLEPFLSEWPKLCIHDGQTITVDSGGEKISGVDAGLTADGFLLIQSAQGLKTVIYGDVS